MYTCGTGRTYVSLTIVIVFVWREWLEGKGGGEEKDKERLYAASDKESDGTRQKFRVVCR